MDVRKSFFAAIPLIGMMFVGSIATTEASVIGDQMSLSYRYPDFDTVYGPFVSTPDPFTAVVGPSVSGVLEGVTTFTGSFSTTGATDTLTYLINTTLSSPTLNAATFNGPVLTVLSGASFGNVLSVTGLVDASRIVDTGSMVGVNLQGVSYNNGDTISITFGVASVPLPPALPLFGAALLGLAAVGWRGRRRLAA